MPHQTKKHILRLNKHIKTPIPKPAANIAVMQLHPQPVHPLPTLPPPGLNVLLTPQHPKPTKHSLPNQPPNLPDPRAKPPHPPKDRTNRHPYEQPSSITRPNCHPKRNRPKTAPPQTRTPPNINHQPTYPQLKLKSPPKNTQHLPTGLH
ncbi:protein TRACHEARY ELEMENT DIFFERENTIATION-RELATED 7A-like [Haliotis rubra]|uniref:protein TRACHEARY ELEMENT DIFFERENTIATION-RELATED 7A-like n=1 Tax=Haliotis rubra TaxID=36100 RepID=UPI001EE5A7F0|nr:protein TRACHEARY ELEMENT DIFFERENTIATION-RELATED 7A-like [Haliotis rubra]